MFGLGEDTEKKSDFIFELERELGDPEKRKDIKKEVEGRIDAIKKMMRAGENEEDFDRWGSVLQGYTSILKVISRFEGK